MKEFLSKLNEFYQHLSTRERRLLFLLCGFLLVGSSAFVGVKCWDELDNRSEHNQSMKTALEALTQKGPQYLKSKAQLEELETKLTSSPLQLNGQIEILTKKYQIDPSPETTPRPPAPIGKKYRVQSLDVRFPKIELQPLLKIMKDLEETPLHLVQITQISIHPWDDKHLFFRADLTVSTYELAPTLQAPSDSKKSTSEPSADSKKENS